LAATPPGKWFEASIPKERVCLRGDSFIALKVAAENGIGVALLPHYLGNSSAQLQRLPIPVRELTTGLWLLTHPDLFRSSKVHAFMDHFEEGIHRDLAISGN